MRCDVNVSVRPVGREAFGTKVEVKNMNSFSGMQKAIDFEIQRQVGAGCLRCVRPKACTSRLTYTVSNKFWSGKCGVVYVPLCTLRCVLISASRHIRSSALPHVDLSVTSEAWLASQPG